MFKTSLRLMGPLYALSAFYLPQVLQAADAPENIAVQPPGGSDVFSYKIPGEEFRINDENLYLFYKWLWDDGNESSRAQWWLSEFPEVSAGSTLRDDEIAAQRIVLHLLFETTDLVGMADSFMQLIFAEKGVLPKALGGGASSDAPHCSGK